MKEYGILDADETIKSDSNTNRKFYQLIGYGFFSMIPILFLSFLRADDHGLFLPRSEMIDAIIPESFIYIKNDYELRCFETDALFWLFIYFIFLGFLNIFFWKNAHQKLFRIAHQIISMGLAIFFAIAMIEDDIFHEMKINNPIGRQAYESKVLIFYKLFIFWTMLQISYFLVFFNDLFSKRNQ